MRRVERTGEAIIITDHGTPTLELRPYSADQIKQDPISYLKGSVLDYTDPFGPVAEDEWDATT